MGISRFCVLRSFFLICFVISVYGSNSLPKGFLTCGSDCSTDSNCTSYLGNPCTFCDRGTCSPMCGVGCGDDSDCIGGGNPCTKSSGRRICINPVPQCGGFCGGVDDACRLFKIMKNRGTYRWLDILPDVVRGYNADKKVGTKFASGEKLIDPFSIGDYVRTIKAKTIFTKAAREPVWSDEVYRILTFDKARYKLIDDVHGYKLSSQTAIKGTTIIK